MFYLHRFSEPSSCEDVSFIPIPENSDSVTCDELRVNEFVSTVGMIILASSAVEALLCWEVVLGAMESEKLILLIDNSNEYIR